MIVALDLPWTGRKVEVLFDRVPVVGELIWHEGMFFEVQQVVWDKSRDAGLGSVPVREPRLIVSLVTR